MLPDISLAGLIISYALLYFGLFSGIYLLIIFLENKENLSPPSKKELPKVSILVPIYNGAKYVKQCLTSLKKLDYPKDKLEIIVIDDGSVDDSFKIAKKFPVKVYKLMHGGKGRALNFGIDKAKGELIGVLDVDSSVARDSLKKIINYFEKDVAAVHSGVRVKNPKKIIESLQQIEYSVSLFFRKLFSLIDALFVTPGVLSVYRADILRKIGKFDERNKTEDLEIALRILSKNYKVRCAPEAKTYTFVPNRLDELETQRVRWNYGLLKNLRKYSFLFSKKYRELGYFVLPVILIGPLLLLMFFSYSLLNFLFSLINNINVLLLSGWEPFLNNFLELRFSLESFQSEIFFYSLIVSIISIILLFFIKKIGIFNDKLYKIILNYAIYLVISGWVYSYFWIVTFYKILKKDIKW